MTITNYTHRIYGSSTKEKIIFLMKNNVEYMFTPKEIAEIISDTPDFVRRKLNELKDEGLVRIEEKGKTREMNGKFYKKEENYWTWDGYL
ncbi:MAG: hypothetical protein ACOC1X_04955 [Promethearchaeota archaeon]